MCCWVPPSYFGVPPKPNVCKKQENQGHARAGREGEQCYGILAYKCMGGTPLCVSIPSGWPWVVCPADAYPHPDHRVCSQPDDGLQPTLQFEPEAVSTCYSKTYPSGEGVGFWRAWWCEGAGI